MGVQWFGHRQLQWRGLCKKKTLEQVTVPRLFLLKFNSAFHPLCAAESALCYVLRVARALR